MLTEGEGAVVPVRLLVINGGCLSGQLCEMLRSLGYEVTTLSCEPDALAQMAHPDGIDGILLDVHQLLAGGMKGIASIRERFPHVSVITTGGVDQLKDLRRSIELGAAEYVVTPTDQELLKRKCSHVFSGRTGSPPVRSPRLQSPQTSPHGTERKG